jgi:hypothetical protein
MLMLLFFFSRIKQKSYGFWKSCQLTCVIRFWKENEIGFKDDAKRQQGGGDHAIVARASQEYLKQQNKRLVCLWWCSLVPNHVNSKFLKYAHSKVYAKKW